MAQTGFTPLSLYYSATATNVPLAANLVAGELALNTADGKLFYKDSGGVVQLLGTKGGVGSSSNTQVLFNSSGLVAGSASLTWNGTTLSASSITNSGLTATRVVYSGTAGLETDSANLTFNGTILTSTGFAGPLNGTVGATTANTGAFTTLTTSSTVTINGGTANGVTYLNGSKVLTSGTALTFDGTTFGVTGSITASGTLSGTGTNTWTLQSVGASGSLVAGGWLYGGNEGFNLSPNGSGLTKRLTISYFTGAAYSEALGISNVNTGPNTGILSLLNDVALVTSNGLEVKQSQLIGYSSYAGIGTNGLAVAGNVGIGTSSPGQKLSVNSGAGTTVAGFTSTGSAAFLGLANSGATTFIGNDSASGNFVIQTPPNGFSTKLTLDSEGNLGLGVTPNTWTSYKALQVNTGATLASTANQMVLGSNWYFNSGDKYLTTDYSTIYIQNSGQHKWFNAPSGTAGNPITFTQAMTLDASGRLGVGTTSPQQKVHLDSAGATYFRADAAGGNNAGLITFDGGNQAQFYNTGGAWVWTTGGTTERARIDASGNLLVGTTSSTLGSSGSIFGGSAGGYEASISVAASGNVPLRLYNQGTSGTQYFMEFRTASAVVGSITYNQTVTLFNTTSDQRLKENIKDAAPASALIDNLQVREFDWKTNGSHQRYGFIAQELVTVAPEAVHQPADPEEMMAVDYSKLVPMLVKEIQDLRKRLAALEAA